MNIVAILLLVAAVLTFLVDVRKPAWIKFSLMSLGLMFFSAGVLSWGWMSLTAYHWHP